LVSDIVLINITGWKKKTLETEVKFLTQWVAAAQLRLLSVFCSKFIGNAIQQLDVALLRVLLYRCDEGPGHRAGRSGRYGGVSTVR